MKKLINTTGHFDCISRACQCAASNTYLKTNDSSRLIKMMCATVPSGQVQIKSLNKGASSVIKVGKEPNFTPPATERQVSQRAGTACSCFPCPAARADQTCLFVRLQRERVSAGWCLFSHGSTRRFCFPPRGVQHFHPRRSKLPTLCETCRGRKAAAETICLTLTPGFLPCTRLWGLFMPVVLA